MRDVVRRSTRRLTPPGEALRAEAAASWGNAAANERFQREWPCLNEIEYRDPENFVTPSTDRLTVTAWNIERCKRVEDSAEPIRLCGADVVLATEMDYGMARSGQRHTTRDLAALLGFGYVFGVEFVELGLGDAWESEQCAGMSNRHGLHGNAILSRWPLTDVSLIPLDAGGYWFIQAPKNDGQYRVGGRMAMAARLALPSVSLILVSVHYESESDAAGRAAQTRTLLERVDSIYGAGPTVIGGDLNTRGFLDNDVDAPTMMAAPAPVEPCFAEFQRYGYDWKTANTGEVTTRLHPASMPGTPLKTLDWLLARGVAASSPFVRAAQSSAGEYLSDHELIGASIAPARPA